MPQWDTRHWLELARLCGEAGRFTLESSRRLPTLFSLDVVAVSAVPGDVGSSLQLGRKEPPSIAVALDAIDFEFDLAFERLSRCHHQQSLQETPHLARETQLDARLRPNDLRVEYAPMHAYHVCIQASLTGTNGSWDQRASGER